jgi:hypothetical protein
VGSGPVMLMGLAIVSERVANQEYGQLMQNKEWNEETELTVVNPKAVFLS